MNEWQTIILSQSQIDSLSHLARERTTTAHLYKKLGTHDGSVIVEFEFPWSYIIHVDGSWDKMPTRA